MDLVNNQVHPTQQRSDEPEVQQLSTVTSSEFQQNATCRLCQWDVPKDADHDWSLTNDETMKQLLACPPESLPLDRTRYIHALIRKALASPDEWKEYIRSRSGPLARDLVEAMHEISESSRRCRQCTGQGPRVIQTRRFLTTLSRKSLVFPAGLCVEGVSCNKIAIDGGGCADIYRGVLRGQVVALKRLRIYESMLPKEEAEKRGKFFRECLVWHYLEHRHIQTFMGIDTKTFATCYCMVSLWQDNGALMTCLNRLEDTLGLTIYVDIWITQAAAGLGYLHENGIVHGDFHPGNVLIDSHFAVRLSDFGFAGFNGATSATQGSVKRGAIRFSAPELLSEDKLHLSFASDIYSFGCFCLQVFTRQPPFPEVTNEWALYGMLNRGARPKIPEMDKLSVAPLPGFWGLVNDCWNAEPSQRPSSKFLVENLPLRQSIFSMEELDSLPPLEWKASASLDKASFLDSGCLHLLFMEEQDDAERQTIISHIQRRGCSEDVLTFVRNRCSGTRRLNRSGGSINHTQGMGPVLHQQECHWSYNDIRGVSGETIEEPPSSPSMVSPIYYSNSSSSGSASSMFYPPPPASQQDFTVGRYLRPTESITPPIASRRHRRSFSASPERSMIGTWRSGGSSRDISPSPSPRPSHRPLPSPPPSPDLSMSRIGRLGRGRSVAVDNEMDSSALRISNMVAMVRGMTASGMNAPGMGVGRTTIGMGGGPYTDTNDPLRMGFTLGDGVPAPVSKTPGTADASQKRRKQPTSFPCPVLGCERTFTTPFDLKGHLRMHAEEKQYQCKSGCDRTFARQDDCKRHEQHHLNIRPYTCRGCRKTFARMEALNLHLHSERGAYCRKMQTGVNGSEGCSEDEPDAE